MRRPVEITQASAVHVVKCKIRELLKSPGLNFFQRMPLEMALKDGGPVEQIAEMMWSEGLHMTVDLEDKKHKNWIENGVVELADE
jgi:hypothetical protein